MEKQNKPDALDRALTDLYQMDVPNGYRAAWRAAVLREERQSMKKQRQTRTLWRTLLPVAAALVLVIGAISAGNLIPTVVYDTLGGAPAPLPAAQYAKDGGSGGGGTNSWAMDSAESYTALPEAEYGMTAAAPAGGAVDARGTDTAAPPQGEAGTKIVRTADLTLATTSYDADVAAVQKLVNDLGGYVASVSLNGEPSPRMDRVAYLSLRVPSDKLDAFLEGIGGIGRIVNRYESATDLSTQYADTSMRLATQRNKMTRLTELIKQASDVTDLLEIESEIADTQYQIDSLESSLRTIDRDVDKSAVSVTMQEQSAGDTAQATELTLWQRIGSGFEASIKGLAAFAQNLLVFVAMLLPVLVPLALLVALVVILRRAWRRKHPKGGANDVSVPIIPAKGADVTGPKASGEPEADGRE